MMKGHATLCQLKDTTTETKNARSALPAAANIEQELSRANALLTALMALQSHCPPRVASHQLYPDLLRPFLALSESPLGFLIRLEPRRSQPLPIREIAEAELRPEGRLDCRVAARSASSLRIENSIIEQSILSKAPRVYRKASARIPDPAFSWLRPAISSALTLPIADRDGLLGVLALANREGGYDQTLAGYLKPLGMACANLIRGNQFRLEAEKDKKRHVSMETLIGDISSRFINMVYDKLNDEITLALSRVGQFTSADRTYIFRFDDAGESLRNTHEWCAEGVEARMDRSRVTMLERDLPFFAAAIQKCRKIFIDSIDQLPQNASREKAAWQARRIRSLAIVPMVYEGALKGIIGMESLRQESHWSAEDNRLLKMVSEIIIAGWERVNAEAKLKESEEKYRTLFETMTQGVVYQDTDGIITSTNPAAERILGRSKEQLIGKSALDPCWEAIHEDGSEFPGEEHPATLAMKLGMEVQNVIMGILHPKGEEHRWILVNAVPQFEQGASTPYQVYTTIEDVTERKRNADKVRSLSLVDNLTGLHNRRGFQTLARQQLKLADRLNRKAHLFFADLDLLKCINDTHGHLAGDHALLDVAVVLRETFRESDILARIAGDEFVVLTVDAPETSLDAIKSRLQKGLDHYNGRSAKPYTLSISIGMACYDPQTPMSLEELLARADNSMYQHKKGKRAFRGKVL